MRITISHGYHRKQFHRNWRGQLVQSCPLEDCNRRYCSMHRLLWSECETATETLDGDRDVIGGTRMILEVSDECPACRRETANKQYEKMLKEVGGKR